MQEGRRSGDEVSRKEIELRKRVEKDLDRTVPDALWEHLKADQFVQYVLNGEEGAYDDLKDRARTLFDVLNSVGSNQGRALASRKTRFPAGNVEMLRAIALGEFYSRLASRIVAGFRERVLEGKLLREEEVHAFLSSHANQLLPLSWFKKNRVLVSSHSSRMWKDRYWLPGQPLKLIPKKIKVDPPGRTFPVRRTPHSAWIDYLDPAQRLVVFPVWKGSVLWRLMALSEQIAASFGWHKSQAIAFILTGKSQPVLPVRVHARLGAPIRIRGKTSNLATEVGSTITITAAPWASASTVRAAFHEAQKVALEGRNKPLSPRSMAVFRAVESASALKGVRPSWRLLLSKWNEVIGTKRPSWRYSSVWNFARDYKRARKGMMFRGYFLFPMVDYFTHLPQAIEV